MLTRRGYALVVVAAVALVMAAKFGSRSLLAVVAPIAVALAAGVLQVRWMDPPQVRRSAPTHGQVGTDEEVVLSLDAPKPFAATVRDASSDGLVADGHVEATVSDSDVTYRVRLAARGEQQLGPVELTARDVLGVCERTFECGSVDDVIVHPRVHALNGAVKRRLDRLRQRVEYSRQEFDQLREYVRGDSLQDVHWKSSAKRPDDDLVVKEYDADDDQCVIVAASAGDGRADDVAEAAASVVSYLLDHGLTVSLVTPAGGATGSGDRNHRVELLTLLARFAAGTVPASKRADADIRVEATENRSNVIVDVNGRSCAFDAQAAPTAGGVS